MSKPQNHNKDPKRVRHTMRRFAQSNGKRAFLLAAASGK